MEVFQNGLNGVAVNDHVVAPLSTEQESVIIHLNQTMVLLVPVVRLKRKWNVSCHVLVCML